VIVVDPSLPATGLPVADDVAVDDLDPRRQLVGEAEPIRGLQCLERLDVIRGRIVVVGEAHFEWDLGDPLDSLGWDPRDRRDR